MTELLAQPICAEPVNLLPIALPVTSRLGSTWLMTPGGSPDRFDTATASGADVVLLDLEDAVPEQRKNTARATVVRYLASTAAPGPSGGRGRPLLGLRLNAVDTVHGLQDVLALAAAGLWPDVVLVPKVESARDLDLVATILDTDAGAVSDAGAPRRMWALIETPRAIECLSEILRAPSLAGVVFGAADYAATAGCRPTGRALMYPRSVLVTAAAAAGLPAIDSPYFDLRNPDGLREEAEHARELGFVSKGAVHPEQLDVIRAVFAPTEAELDHARAVVAAADRADGGIVAVDGRMVGPPMVAAARAAHAHARHAAHPGPGAP